MAHTKKSSISFRLRVEGFRWLKNLIKYPPMINAATYASQYHRISKKLKEKITGSIEGCVKIIILNITNTHIIYKNGKQIKNFI